MKIEMGRPKIESVKVRLGRREYIFTKNQHYHMIHSTKSIEIVRPD